MSDEMEIRLTALEQPGHLGKTLEKRDFWLLAAIALILPVVLLIIAWGW